MWQPRHVAWVAPLLALAALAACQDTGTGPITGTEGPFYEIVDAAHGTGGNPDFFFLPPLVPHPGGDPDFDPGGFDGSLSPVVEVCESDGVQCLGGPSPGFPIVSGSALFEAATVPEGDERYQANWHTDLWDLRTDLTYRIRVLVAGTELGHADVDVVGGGNELKNVDTGEYIPLKDGRTLPIGFRIEHGAVFVAGPAGASISAIDGDVTLIIPEGALTDDVGITVRPVEADPAPDILSGTIFEFGPSGTVFSPPAMLTIRYDPALIPPDRDERYLALAHLVGGVWTTVAGSSVDLSAHAVTGPASGFSTWGVISEDSPPPPLSAPFVFQSDRDGDYEIFIWDGTDLQQLTNNTATDGAPDWLGSRIVFQSDRSGNSDIWVMDEDGGSLVNLTNSAEQEYAPAWSPYGERIAFVRRMPAGDYDVWVMFSDGSDPVNLTADPANDAAPAWSPDGSRIAFRSDRDGQQEIYVVDSEGSLPPTRLTFDADKYDSSPTWSPDGSSIAFSKYVTSYEGEIWVMGADGSDPHRVTGAEGAQDTGPAWSPDGNQILFQRFSPLPYGQADIWLTTPEGDGPFLIIGDPAQDVSVDWGWPEIPNTPPVLAPIEDVVVDEGTEVLIDGAFTDPDPDRWEGLIEWGDGSRERFQAADRTIHATHAYPAGNGTYPARVTLFDGAGGEDTGEFQVTVHNVAPVVNAGADQTGVTTGTLTFDGSIVDPGGLDALVFLWRLKNPWTGEIQNFGKGSLTPEYDFTTSGDYLVWLQVQDSDSESYADTLRVQVVNRPPSATINVQRVSAFTYAFTCAKGDPDPGDTLVCGWTFGDGTDGSGDSVTHTYSTAGTFHVSLEVRDYPGGAAAHDMTDVEAAPILSEVRITNTYGYELGPRLGQDAFSEIVAYILYDRLPNNPEEPTGIWYQRLFADGTPDGPAQEISEAAMYNYWPDISGSRIVYMAADPGDISQSSVMLYDVATGETKTLTPPVAVVQEPRIDGDVVVWVEGQPGATTLKYLDLTWAEGSSPIKLGGPFPAVGHVEIGEDYIVWSEGSGGQSDILAYDRNSGAVFVVSADPGLDEDFPAVSGRWAVWQSVDGSGQSTIRIADLRQDPISPSTLVDTGVHVDFPSIDGDVVAFTAGPAGGDYQVHLVRISNGAIFPVSNALQSCFLPNLRGDKIAYQCIDNVGSMEIYLTKFDIH